jgi:hypothetical protein
MEPT